jgi:hypothetical protein
MEECPYPKVFSRGEIPSEADCVACGRKNPVNSRQVCNSCQTQFRRLGSWSSFQDWLAKKQLNPYPIIHKMGTGPAIADCVACERKSARIVNKSRQLCATCNSKYLHYGKSCDVPSCPVVFDGSSGAEGRKGKILCASCTITWRKSVPDYEWQQFCDYRASWFARPKPFENTTLEEKNMVCTRSNGNGAYDVADCQVCHKNKPIYNYTYQLCMDCMTKEQFRGRNCAVCDYHADGTVAMFLRKQDGEPLCSPCYQRLHTFNLSLNYYREKIQPITNCPLCDTELIHRMDLKNGSGDKGSALNIDHDHQTGLVRGVLCGACNLYEGKISKYDCPEEFLTSLQAYLADPPAQRLFQTLASEADNA